MDLHSHRLAFEHIPGARDTVIFIHGNSSSKDVFAGQRDALASAGLGVTTLDLPGHGASADAADPVADYSFSGYAAAVSRLVDGLGLGRVHLVGWSLGGHVSIELAAGGDRRIRSVFVTGTPPVRPGAEALADAFAATPDMALAGRETFSRGDAEAYVRAMLGCDGAAPPRMVEAALRTDGRARRFMVENGLAGVGADQRAFAASPAVPFAIFQGRRDPFLRMDYFERLPQHGLWRGGVQFVDDLGHAPHWRAPERFNGALLAFLADAGA